MSILNALRQVCSPLHEKLEAELDVIKRVQTRRAYAELLARFYGFIAPVERRLGALKELEHLGLDIPARMKTPKLERDLRALKFKPEAAIDESALPKLTGVPAAMGWLYVLEGSTLGGQMLTRHFGRSLGLDVEHGLAYFNGYGAETGRRWKSYLEILAQNYDHASEDERAEVIAAAFDCFYRLGAALGAKFDAR